MRIDWWTLGLQAINFLVLVWLLWRFLYRPVKAVIEKRKELTERAFAEADTRKDAAEAARQRFEEAQAELARERQDMLKKIHEEQQAERREILEEAKREADKLLESTREAIAEERESALREMRGEVAALAVELASGLLEKAGTNAAADVFLDGLEQRLRKLPAEERERLRKDLEPDDARLTVVTAAPLTPSKQDVWREMLNTSLEQKHRIDFTTDPAILGGAELRFPHAVLKFTWADQLEKAEELLGGDELTS